MKKLSGPGNYLVTKTTRIRIHKIFIHIIFTMHPKEIDDKTGSVVESQRNLAKISVDH
jgi:hypothetical protein